MQKTTFRIAQMDCPSEQEMINFKLADLDNVRRLEFDLVRGRLVVYHLGNYEEILARLDSLQLGTSLLDSHGLEAHQDLGFEQKQESRLLWQVLGINFFFFVLELLTGFLSASMGLVADGLDMLADSIVYGLALSAVGATVRRKKNIAKYAAYLQAGLAFLGFLEVLRRFVGLEEIPDFQTIIVISVLALIGNGLCLYLLQKSQNKEAHLQASMIFTSNDVIVNLGVIVAGVLVYATQSKYPDLVVGTIVFVLVGKGALKILQLSK